ncbi:hypothetical protein MUK42_26914 [Musa troglodytarum]|uniref:Uncharacterized protein n=1 Tax=Musa troglodytarum TaxID=320322 RepID=A0A9E7JYH4_9LILI|nr:hypothetical protein MUK42_26914 [Musa troglodytarum]
MIDQRRSFELLYLKSSSSASSLQSIALQTEGRLGMLRFLLTPVDQSHIPFSSGLHLPPSPLPHVPCPNPRLHP